MHILCLSLLDNRARIVYHNNASTKRELYMKGREKMSIGKKLRALRGVKPQREVAADLGITKSALSMYEQDKRVPRDEIKLRIAKYYNVSVIEIFF